MLDHGNAYNLSMKRRLLHLGFAALLTTLGCELPKAAHPDSPQDHQFAVYTVNEQAFLVDGKTGDVWVYGETKDGKGFTSVPVRGLGGLMQQYNPKTKSLEPYHEYPSWFHPQSDQPPVEGAKKINSSGDHVVFHNGEWKVDTEQDPAWFKKFGGVPITK